MSRWYGIVGFVTTSETSPGVWTEAIEEHYYSGDLIRRSSSYSGDNLVNEDISLSLDIEILADPFAYANYSHIRYVEVMGTKWKVTSVDSLNYPRLSLSVGGIYEN